MSYLAMNSEIEEAADRISWIDKFLREKGEEVRENAISNLCVDDLRSKDFEDYGQEQKPVDVCACDRCLSGRSTMANIILEMLDLLEG